MTTVIKQNLKLVRSTQRKNLLTELVRRKLSTRDLLDKETKRKRGPRVQVLRYLMTAALTDAEEEEGEYSVEYNKAKTNLYEVVHYRSKPAKQFRQVREKAAHEMWEEGNNANKQKIKNLIVKNRVVTEIVPANRMEGQDQIIKGVKGGDDFLEMPPKEDVPVQKHVLR